MKRITEFRGEYFFLSNFSPSKIWVFDLMFLTAEHLYQSLKVGDGAKLYDTMERFSNLPTPLEAKRQGQDLPLWDRWEEEKDRLMYVVVRSKFMQNRDLNVRLQATGDRTLIEGNRWGDRYWGMVRENGKLIGRNRLGKILMKVREELKDW